MDTEEQIFADVAFSLDVSDDIYQQAIKEFHSQRLRYKMGGDEGIHFPEQDPPSELDPKS